MDTSVRAALRGSGGLNAGRLLAIASVPVMTADATAKARRMRKRQRLVAISAGAAAR